MINLIPPSAQDQVRKEYWIRVISVWAVLLGSACVVVAIFNAPAYVLVSSQLSSYLQEYNQAALENESFKESERAVVRSNEIAALLARSDESLQFSEVMSHLESLTGSAVEITEFDFTRSGDTIQSIAISGEAESRLALSMFHEAIESDSLFQSASLPLSNLAKDKDIPFTITIVPRNNEQE